MMIRLWAPRLSDKYYKVAWRACRLTLGLHPSLFTGVQSNQLEPNSQNHSLKLLFEMSHTVDENWVRSDLYHNSFLVRPDPALEHAIEASDEAGLDKIAVSPAQGKLLNLLARSINAKRILEVGTLGG